MTEVTNLTALRNLPITTDAIYVKGYDNAGDGGGGVFLWRTDAPFTTGDYSNENYGTIIKSSIVPNNQGSWIRQYDGYINVNYFGALGTFDSPIQNYNVRIQNAINFASLNSKTNPTLKSSTVFIPNGSYLLSNILLKTGVSIIGESIGNTNIYCIEGNENEYLFNIEIGIVQINISNLNIIGSNPSTGLDSKKGCFYFNAQPNIPNPSDPVAHGGLWYSCFKNIMIRKFKGNGIYLKGGTDPSGLSSSLIPNQFNIFENVRVFKNNDASFSLFFNALKMTGQIGQHTFINCQFDGFNKTTNGIKTYDKWINVSIENTILQTGPDYQTSNVVTFLNCTIQDSDYGVRINYAENITFDNCWFENLGVAITVIGDKDRSKSINILNNRFANASGFGSLSAPFNIKAGQCISVSKSVVNIYNNYVTASYPNSVDDGSSFIYGFPDNGGINCYNNTFRDNNPKLSRTLGIKQDVVIASSIDCKSNKLVFVGQPKSPIPPIIPIPAIKNIISAINAGELLIIRADGISITFNKLEYINGVQNGNILLANRNTFTLASNEIATFVKIDFLGVTNNESYQLLSFTKSTP